MSEEFRLVNIFLQRIKMLEHDILNEIFEWKFRPKKIVKFESDDSFAR